MSFFEAIGSFFANLPSEIYVFLISVLPIIELRGAIPVGAGLGLPFYENYLLSVIGNLLPVPFILLFIPAILDFMARFKAFRPIVLWLRKKADKHKHKVLGGESGASNGGESGAKECDFDAEKAEKRDTPPTLSENAAEISENKAAAQSAEIAAEKAEVTAAQSEETAIDNATGAAVDGAAEETVDANRDLRPMTRGIFIALMLFVAIPLPGTGAWTGSLIASLFNLPKRWSFLAVMLGVLTSGVVMCLASYGVVGFLGVFMPH